MSEAERSASGWRLFTSPYRREGEVPTYIPPPRALDGGQPSAPFATMNFTPGANGFILNFKAWTMETMSIMVPANKRFRIEVENELDEPHMAVGRAPQPTPYIQNIELFAGFNYRVRIL
jgi:hypothetical protein